MAENGWLAERFQEHREHLERVAYRILGSPGEAEDAVQEAWMRLDRSGAEGVQSLGGWLTTTVARVCLDMLRTRRAQGKLKDAPPRAVPEPDAELSLADSIGPALLLVLDTLAPSERVAFVLHDVFDLPFEEIGPIVGRSAVAARQLASRARRRIRGGNAEPDAELGRQRAVVDAFLAASRDGDFDGLLAVLDPDAVLRADEVAIQTAHKAGAGAPALSAQTRGHRAIAEAFKGRARGARPALIDGAPGAAWAQAGKVRAVFAFTVEGDKIVELHVLMDPARLAQLEISLTA